MLRRRNVRGLTLVELITAISIAGIVIAIALPSFKSLLARKRLEGVANELITDLRYARNEAAQGNRSVGLSVGSGGACYVILAQTPCDCSPGPDACTTTRMKRVDLPNDVRLTALTAGASVEFDSLRGLRGGTQTFVASSTGGPWTLEINVSRLARVRSCSPGGNLLGFPPCP